jgi:hypothetical protein
MVDPKDPSTNDPQREVAPTPAGARPDDAQAARNTTEAATGTADAEIRRAYAADLDAQRQANERPVDDTAPFAGDKPAAKSPSDGTEAEEKPLAGQPQPKAEDYSM